MRIRMIVGALGLVLMLTCAICAQPTIQVGEIPWPHLVWGQRTIQFDMTNTGEWVKFATVTTDIGKFDGSYTTPHRSTRAHYILPPDMVTKCELPVNIPGNYGLCTLWVRVYEVVDTLDEPDLGELVLEQPFRMNFNVPEQMLQYRQEMMSIPPGLELSPSFDSEMYRLMFLFLQQGKSLDDIGHITNAKPDFVAFAADQLKLGAYLSQDSAGVYHPKIPVISTKEAEEVRELANRTSDKLVALISENMPALDKTIDSMIKVGAVTPEGKGNFLEGSSLLFRPYPFITAMFLWNSLGDVFVTGGKGLFIFDPSTLCNPFVGQYTYVVHGGAYFNGTQYFDVRVNPSEYMFYFAPKTPAVWCGRNLDGKKRLYKGSDWNFEDDVPAEALLYDSLLINPAIAAMAQNAPKLISETLEELNTVHAKYGFDAMTTGVRYWFWNLTVSVTTDKLVKAGIIQPEQAELYQISRKR